MKLKPTPEAAREFLEVLDAGAKSFCFQTFDDHKSRRDEHLAHTIHAQAHRVFPTLERLNNEGAGIFVCVNEIKPGTRRLLENLARVRAVFQDDDKGWSDDFPLPPSITVQSSPGKFQRYWIASELAPELQQAIQSRLVADFGCDPGARDLVRVLRLPGFWHMKKPEEPHLVKLIEAPGWIYSAEQLVEAFPPIWPEPPKKSEWREFGGREFERLMRALACIPSDDRLTWFQVACALKGCFGDAARDIWDAWSATSAKFNPKTQHSTWKSIKRSHGIGLGTLFHLAREHGFQGGRQ